MANEITIQTELMLARSGVFLQGIGNKQIDQTGTRGVTKFKSDTRRHPAIAIGVTPLAAGQLVQGQLYPYPPVVPLGFVNQLETELDLASSAKNLNAATL